MAIKSLILPCINADALARLPALMKVLLHIHKMRGMVTICVMMLKQWNRI